MRLIKGILIKEIRIKDRPTGGVRRLFFFNLKDKI